MKFKEFPLNVKIRLICSFFINTVNFAITPFMIIYFSNEIGKALTGILVTISIVIYFLSGLIGGYLADRFPRKNILFIGQLSNVIIQASMAICINPSINAITGLCVLFILNGVANSIYKPALSAIIIDSTNKDNRKYVYAYDYWLVNLSLALGTALGGLLYKNYKFELFVFSTLVLIVTTTIFYKYLIDSSIKKEKVDKIWIKDLIHNYSIALKDSRWIKFVASSALIFSAEFSLGNYIGVRLSQEFKLVSIGAFHLDGVKMLSAIQIENTLIVLLLTFTITKLSGKFPEKQVFLLGLLMYVWGYGLIATFNSIVPLLVTCLIASIGELLYAPIRQVKQADLIPDNKRASYLAFGALSNQGASLIAGLGLVIGAYIQSEWISFYIISLGSIGIILIWIASFTIKKEKKIEEQQMPAEKIL
ncbi:MFS transporter [Peribacillus frigoritolerans]|uniref:MFS transporter n=1 Tax=Peribacillus frigoritolerans TaxID=450367 RepID=UPI003CFEF575